MSHRGRKPLLDDLKKAQILKVLASGCSRRIAANFIGCDLKTIYNSAQRDPEFARKLGSCEAAVNIAHSANLRKAGKETRYWRASSWYLQCHEPELYARRKIDTVTHEQLSQLLSALVKAMIEEVPIDRYQKRMMKRLDEMLDQISDNCEENYERRRISRERKRDFAEFLQSQVDEKTKTTQNPREKMAGKIPACQNIAVIPPPNHPRLIENPPQERDEK